MSIIEISLFCFLIILITVLQSAIVYIYFGEFFSFRFEKRLFLIITFFYMLVIKFVNGKILIRLVLLLLFLFLLTAFALLGSIEKKIYHVLSFTFSLTLCELTFSTLSGENGIDIQTEYLKWISIYFLINIIFFLLLIIIIKILMYFREKNGEGLTNKEYLLLSIIPLASLIIIYVSTNMLYLSKSIICVCLIFINLSYIIIYDRIKLMRMWWNWQTR